MTTDGVRLESPLASTDPAVIRAALQELGPVRPEESKETAAYRRALQRRLEELETKAAARAERAKRTEGMSPSELAAMVPRT